MRTFGLDVWWGLRSAPGRSLLALGSLTVGIFASTVLLACLAALNRQADDLLAAFGAETAVVLFEGEGASPAVVDAIRGGIGEKGVVAPFRVFAASGGEAWTQVVCDAQLGVARRWRILEGRRLDVYDSVAAGRRMIAPDALCRQMGWRVGETVLLGREAYVLVGRFADVREEVLFPAMSVYIPVSSGGLQADQPGAGWGGLVLKAADGYSPGDLQMLVERLLHTPDGLPDETSREWITPVTLLAGIRQWQLAVAWTAGVCGVLGLALGASLLAGLLGSSVKARTREIGLRRALGASRRDVAALFVAEAMVLTLCAGALGVAAAEAGLHLWGAYFPFPFAFDSATRLLPLLVGLTVGAACALAPAWAAARLAPAEALRND